MEKNVEISVLCQIYGRTLTDKQYAIINDYYNNDLSLSEIAENNNITRQAVRDIIKKSENKLYELEDNISFMKKILNDEKILNQIEVKLGSIEKELTKLPSSNCKKIEEDIEFIRLQLKKINE